MASGSAAGAAAGADGGWPSEIFEPDEEARAEKLELTCAICQLVMREPTLLGCAAEHALCRTCAEKLAWEAGHPFQYEYMRAQLKCPVDREVVDRDRFKPAVRDARRINELRVHCRFEGRGCGWRGDLGSFAGHEAGCAAGRARCGGCGAAVRVDELPAHEAACLRPCPNAALGCSARVSLSDREAHLESCLRSLVERLSREKEDAVRERERLAQENAQLKERAQEALGTQRALERRIEAGAARERALRAREQCETMCQGELRAQLDALREQLGAMTGRAEAAEAQLAGLQAMGSAEALRHQEERQRLEREREEAARQQAAREAQRRAEEEQAMRAAAPQVPLFAGLAPAYHGAGALPLQLQAAASAGPSRAATSAAGAPPRLPPPPPSNRARLAPPFSLNT